MLLLLVLLGLLFLLFLLLDCCSCCSCWCIIWLLLVCHAAAAGGCWASCSCCCCSCCSCCCIAAASAAAAWWWCWCWRLLMLLLLLPCHEPASNARNQSQTFFWNPLETAKHHLISCRKWREIIRNNKLPGGRNVPSEILLDIES